MGVDCNEIDDLQSGQCHMAGTFYCEFAVKDIKTDAFTAIRDTISKLKSPYSNSAFSAYLMSLVITTLPMDVSL